LKVDLSNVIVIASTPETNSFDGLDQYRGWASSETPTQVTGETPTQVSESGQEPNKLQALLLQPFVDSMGNGLGVLLGESPIYLMTELMTAHDLANAWLLRAG